MRNNSAEWFIEDADGVFRARDIRMLEPHRRWDKEAVNSAIGVPWRLTDGRWTVDRPAVRAGSIPIPPLPLTLILRERITKQDIDEFGHTVMLRAQPDQRQETCTRQTDCCRVRIEECFRVIPQGAETLDRRSEVEEKKGTDQQKESSIIITSIRTSTT